MAVDRLRPADLVTGLAGIVLLVVLFLPWYEGADGGSISAWSAFAVTDVWFALTALLALAVLVLTAVRDSPALPLVADVLTATVSVVAVILALAAVLGLPEDGSTREWGLWVGVLAVLGVTVGAWRALRDERGPGLRPPPEARTLPAPPRETAAAEPTATET